MTPEILEFGQVQKLTDRLRELVRKYPKGVGIFKEFLQNADDAGASRLRVILDARNHSTKNLQDDRMSVLQGPSLVFVNDMPFSPDDWAKIQEIGNSGKVDDVQKTGRFGLGFNSVYNVTDYPMLLSQGQLGIFDPHHSVVPSGQNKPGMAFRIDQLQASGSDLLSPFLDYGIDGDTEFAPTIFRLPLRTKSLASHSEISSEPFVPDDFTTIVQGIGDQGNGLLLFLNHVLSFDIQLIKPDGSCSDLLTVQTLNLDEVEASRLKVRENLQVSTDVLDLLGTQEVFYEHKIATTDTGGITTEIWSVVRGLYVSDELAAGATLMKNAGEKAVPLAGAAVQVSAPVTEGMLSCTLPLPTSSGIPLHIDGYFDLQDSRQDLHQEETAAGFQSQTRVEWNRSLLKDGCAVAAAALLEEVGERLGSPVYEHWPVVRPSGNRLVDDLPKLVYEQLATRNCLTAGPELEFCLPSKVFIAPTKLREPLLADRLYLSNPAVPTHVRIGFDEVGHPVTKLDSTQLRAHLKRTPWQDCSQSDSPIVSLRNRSWLIEMLEFCLKDEDSAAFDGVPLALAGDDTLRAFGFELAEPIYLGKPNERQLLLKLPQVFLDTELQKLEVERLPGVVSMDLPSLINQLPKLFTTISNGLYLERASTENELPSTEWLIDFYKYCVEWIASEPFFQLTSFETLSVLPLVPDDEGDLWGMGTRSTPIFETHRKQSSWKSRLVDLANEHFVSSANQINEAIRDFQDSVGSGAIRSFDLDVIADLMNDPATAEGFVQEQSNINGLINFLASNITTSTSHGTLARLAKLPIYPTVNGNLTTIASAPVYLPTDFTPPSVGLSIKVLVAENDQVRSLLGKLGAKPLTRFNFVVDNLFKSFVQLTVTDQFSAMDWFRREYYSLKAEVTDIFDNTIDEVVSRAKIVRCEDGVVRSPSEIYHPNCAAIASTLATTVHFPDLELYGSDDWLNFLSTLGINDQIQAADVVSAIDGLIASGFSESIAQQLHQIANLIDSHWDSLSVQTMGDENLAMALNTRAWLPAITVCPGDYPSSMFKLPTQVIFKPSEILQSNFRDLGASISPICRFPIGIHLASSLTFKPLLIEDVLCHFDNAIAAAREEMPGKQHKQVFHQIYDCLGRTIENDSIQFDSSNLRTRYRQQPCLIDDHNRLWPPQNCFKSGAGIFLGYRGRVTYPDSAKETFATACGRSDTPKLEDYRRYFLQLETDVGDNEVSEDKRPTLATAYQRAAKLGTANDLSGCLVLSDSGKLVRSDQLLLDDAPWLSERAQKAGLQFLDASLGVNVAKVFGVGQLSKVVSERIESSHGTSDTNFRQVCANIAATIHSPQFASGLYRLMHPDKRNRDFVERLHSFVIQPASSIQTVLCWEDDDLLESLGDAGFVFDGQTLHCTSIKKTVLQRNIASTICKRLLYEYDIVDEASVSAIVGESPEETKELLDQMRIPDVPEDEQLELALDFDDKPVATFDAQSGEAQQLNPQSSFSASGTGGTLPSTTDATAQSTGIANGKPASESAFEFGSAKPRGARERDGNSGLNGRKRVVTYVYSAQPSASRSSEANAMNRDVDQSAVEAVLEHERTMGRDANSMDHSNEGYDIASRLEENGDIIRYIEVKGQRGAWGERGISLTPSQVRYCQVHGDKVWLYVVEFAGDPDRRVIHEFQNPISVINEYRLDAGWKALSVSTTGSGGRVPVEGGRIHLKDIGEGTIINIESYGALTKLTIEFDSGSSEILRYPNSNIQILA